MNEERREGAADLLKAVDFLKAHLGAVEEVDQSLLQEPAGLLLLRRLFFAFFCFYLFACCLLGFFFLVALFGTSFSSLLVHPLLLLLHLYFLGFSLFFLF